MSGAIPFDVSSNMQRYPVNSRYFVTHNTASRDLRYRETGSVQTNLGAGDTVTLTLPQNADKGIWFQFVVGAAQELRIDPGARGAIYIGGAKQTDNLYITADDEAESVTLVADGNGDWLAFNVVGTWGVEGS